MTPYSSSYGQQWMKWVKKKVGDVLERAKGNWKEGIGNGNEQDALYTCINFQKDVMIENESNDCGRNTF